jgi:adenine-specific DNA methylase
MNDKRLIEVAFPLKQTSIDSVHEKNVRHGHISTLHLWPARRPLAASRAALIATLLPDPGDKEKRDELLKRLGGTLSKTLKKKKMPNGRVEEIEALETVGGILHWGRESSPELKWFREAIRAAYGGRAPRVLDPFAGGGAIPLEAMRLGCEVTAVDINPVAWFVLKCTLEYPQKLAGQVLTLPSIAQNDREFMAAYLKAKGLARAEIESHLQALDREQAVLPIKKQEAIGRGENFSLLESREFDPRVLDAELAWHIRAWGDYVLRDARKALAKYYPCYAEYCALKPYRRVQVDSAETLKAVPLGENGEPQIDLLNVGFEGAYLANLANPRWVAKPTIAYLWARAVNCKACRGQVPLLKTRWLAKSDKKRVVLTMTPRPDKSGVDFGVDEEVRTQGGNAAQKRENDKRLGAGTMSRAGATCPCCGTIMTPEDLRLEAQSGRLSHRLLAVVIEGPDGKEYRSPTELEIARTEAAVSNLPEIVQELPFGLPVEPIPVGASRSGGGSAFTVSIYGLDQWHKLFAPTQLLTVSKLALEIRAKCADIRRSYPEAWATALTSYLGCILSRTTDYMASLCVWEKGAEEIKHTFMRWALPITWDFAEANPLGPADRYWKGAVSAVASTIAKIHETPWQGTSSPTVVNGSATQALTQEFDVIVTDPPYYDAIPYSDLMDFFYVWLRRTLNGASAELDSAFANPLSPKWSHESNDGELIDDAARFDGSREASKRNYEEGMARAFLACHKSLSSDGRLVIVFAHKHPDAWETLVAAIIRSGFVVDGSWPVMTEMPGGLRNLGRASLSSSVWLVCKKRNPLTKAGWDAQVVKDMEAGITTKLREFWDAGIRGPDFIWAATGPALETYSRFPAVKKASEAGALMSVTDFLRHVRRIVVDFVVGRVLSHGQSEPTPGDHPLDDVTTYYLLHRNDFGLKEAPAGPCILYAVSCGLSESDLADQYELLARGGSTENAEDADSAGDDQPGEADEVKSSGSGGKYKLKDWRARKHRSLGIETSGGRAIPLIDQAHKLMQLWVAGDVVKVNNYVDSRALRRSQVFSQLIQALIEKSRAEGCSEECSILERMQNYLRSLGSTAQAPLGLE